MYLRWMAISLRFAAKEIVINKVRTKDRPARGGLFIYRSFLYAGKGRYLSGISTFSITFPIG